MAKAAPQYSIAFNEHPVHENLRQLKEQFEGLSDTLLDLAQEHDPHGSLARIEPAVDYVGALLASADTALVTVPMLDELATSAQQTTSELTLFKEKEDWAHIPAIQANVDGLLSAAMRIAPAIGVWTKTDEKKAAALFGEAASAKTNQLQQQASDLQGQLDRLREQATQSEDSLKTTSEERLNELQGRLDTLKAEADAERARVQQTIDSFETQFNAEQETRNTQFQEIKDGLTGKSEQSIEEIKTAAEEAAGKEKERAETAIANIERQGEQAVAVLDEQKEKASRLVELVTTGSTAGAFSEEAKEQKRQADRWRWFAIIGGVVAVLVALAAVVLAAEGIGNGASMIVAKVTAVTLLLGIAGYAAGQSGQHRRREQRAKRLELELVAFDPFTEPLPPEEKNVVRKDFIARLFVGDPGEDHKGDDVKVSDENLSVLLKFMDMIRSS